MKPDMRWWTDAECRCTDISDAFCSFVGRERKDLLGHGWADHVHVADRERVWKEVRDHWVVRQPFVVFYKLRRLDGVYVDVRAWGQPWPSLSGEFSGYWGDVVIQQPSIVERCATRASVVQLPQRLVVPPALLIPPAPEVGIEVPV